MCIYIYMSTSTNDREWNRVNEKTFHVFVPSLSSSFSALPAFFYVMSPCKETLWSSQTSWLWWIVGALEPFQDLHLVRVTREHLQRALASTLGKFYSYFFFPFISLVKYRFTAMQRKRNRLPELQSRASGVKRERCIIHIKFYMYEIINLGRSTC